MDPQQLLAVLEATFSPVPEQRHQAETVLAQLSKQHGFSTVLLQLVATDDMSAGVRQAGAIYFKNMVVRSWNVPQLMEGEQPGSRFEISDADKSVAREHLVDTFAKAGKRVRTQLLTAISKIVDNDFPKAWTGLLPQVCTFLSSQNPALVVAGLQVLLEIVRKYEYKEARDLKSLEPVIHSTYPLMLQLLSHCVANPVPETGEAARTICKIVYTTISFNLPKPLRNPATLQPWIQALLHVVSMPIPADPVQRDPAEKHKFSWWNAKKWACLCLNRLFERYGNEAASGHIVGKREKAEMKEFGKAFYAQVVPLILETYLNLLDLVRQGQFVSSRVKHAILSFLSESLKFGNPWKKIKPFVMIIVREIVFPLLCFSDADQETWDADALDFVRSQFDVEEDIKSPAIAGRTLLYELVTNREASLFPILQFCQEVLTRYATAAPEARNAREKDGVLNLLKSFAKVLTDMDDLDEQLELLVVHHVLPEVNSPVPFLRMRSIDLLGALCRANYPNPSTLPSVLQAVLPHMTDPELPVAVFSVLSIGSLIDREELQEFLRPLVGQIMNILLKLRADHELEEASFVMDKLIESYADELGPVARPICASLCENFMRLIDPSELSNIDDDDEAAARGFNAMMTLRSICVLVRAMDGSEEIMASLEDLLVPVVSLLLSKVEIDYMEEVCELVAMLTFCERPLSPAVWQLYDLLVYAFTNGAFDYFKEMLPAFDNFISKSEAFLSVPARMQVLVEMIGNVLTNIHLGEEDRSSACTLIEAVFMNCRGHVDSLVQPFVVQALNAFNEAEYPHLKVTSLNAVVNAIYYNPALALQVLHSSNLLAPFFSAWSSNLKLFKRVADKKLSILTLCALYNVPFGNLPPLLQGGYSATVTMFIELFEKLPAAYALRAEYEKYMAGEDDDEDDEDEEAPAKQTAANADEDGDVINEEDEEYMRYLSKKLKKMSPLRKMGGKNQDEEEEEEEDGDEAYEDEDEDDEDAEEDDEVDFDEDLFVHLPIDPIDEYLVFAQTFRNLAQTNPQAFAILSQVISTEQHAAINAALKIADEHAVEAAEKAAKQAQASA